MTRFLLLGVVALTASSAQAAISYSQAFAKVKGEIRTRVISCYSLYTPIPAAYNLYKTPIAENWLIARNQYSSMYQMLVGNQNNPAIVAGNTQQVLWQRADKARRAALTVRAYARRMAIVARNNGDQATRVRGLRLAQQATLLAQAAQQLRDSL